MVIQTATINITDSINYLGTVIGNDGCLDSELNRRIGMVKGEFLALQKLWKHSSLGKARKLYIEVRDSRTGYLIPAR